jgi:hypothetical protein
MPNDSDEGGKTVGGVEGAGDRSEDIEIHVAESDIKNLTLLDRSDTIFAVLYGVLFLWGLILTLLAI